MATPAQALLSRGTPFASGVDGRIDLRHAGTRAALLTRMLGMLENETMTRPDALQL
jgi:hypothetical protein